MLQFFSHLASIHMIRSTPCFDSKQYKYFTNCILLIWITQRLPRIKPYNFSSWFESLSLSSNHPFKFQFIIKSLCPIFILNFSSLSLTLLIHVNHHHSIISLFYFKSKQTHLISISFLLIIVYLKLIPSSSTSNSFFIQPSFFISHQTTTINVSLIREEKRGMEIIFI